VFGGKRATGKTLAFLPRRACSKFIPNGAERGYHESYGERLADLGAINERGEVVAKTGK